MKALFKSKVVGVLAVLLMVSVLVLSLIGNASHSQSAHAIGNTSAVSNVQGYIFPNPADSGTFNVSPFDTPIFTETFPLIAFNPPTSMQTCSNSTGVDEYSRPFTNVATNADGSCTTTIVQGNGQQAGVSSLSSFEAEFTASLAIPQAGQFDLNVYADDGWILSIGSDGNGNQPAYVAGPLNNAPANGKAPFTGYHVIGANNGPSSPTQLTVTANFPAAGTYPIEVDYTECCSGQLTLVLGDLVPSTVTPTPPSGSTPTPGGMWIDPTNTFTITNDTMHLAAHAYHTNPGDPFIGHVNFTVFFLGVNPNSWTIPCTVSNPTPGTTDVYECNWNLSPGVPNGKITISFDVYDTAGNKSLAPNGMQQGTINRPVQSLLLAPMPAGTTLKIIHGYNDPLPGQNCPQPGDGIADHCMNQQYGLDLIPIATSANPNPSNDIIAPASGTVAWTSSECLGLTLDEGNVNLTICHFSSFNTKLTQVMHVNRGYFLGTMKDHIHLNIDDRNDTVSPSPGCSPAAPRTCRPIPFNGGYFTIENQSFDPGFDQNGNPIPDQYDCVTTNGQQICTTILSTNIEIKN